MAINWEELFKNALAGNGGIAPTPTPRPDQPALAPMGATVAPEKPTPSFFGSLFGNRDSDGSERHGSYVSRLFQDDPDKQDALSNGLVNFGAAMMMGGAPSTNPAATSFLGNFGAGLAAGNKAFTDYGNDKADADYKRAQIDAAKAKSSAAEQQRDLIKGLFGGGGEATDTGSFVVPSGSSGGGVASDINAERARNEKLFNGLAALGNDDLAGKVYTQMHYMDNQMAEKGYGWNGSTYAPLPGFVDGQHDIEKAKADGRKAGEAPYDTTTDITNYNFGKDHPDFIDPANTARENAQKAADNKAADDARTVSQNDFKNEQDLRKEYTASPVYKNYTAVRGSYDRIQSGAARNTGAGDLGIIYGYMKMLDPGSVVREGEFATAENASGVPTYVANLYNKLLNGERLTEDQRKEFVGAAGDLYNKERDKLNELNGQYTDIAGSKKIDVTKVITEPKDYSAKRVATKGTVQQGDDGVTYEFQGGDPKDKKNWKPIQ